MRLKIPPLVVGDMIILEHGFRSGDDGHYLNEDERTFTVVDVAKKGRGIKYTTEPVAGKIVKVTHAQITDLMESDSIEIRRADADAD